MAYYDGSPSVVRNGLVIYLDAANPKSYPGTGTTWFDLSGNGNNFTLGNLPTFTKNYFTLNDSNHQGFASINNVDLTTTQAITINVMFQPITYPNSGNPKILYEFTSNYNSFPGTFISSYNDTSISQNYQIFVSLKGNVGLNTAVYDKSNLNDLNWKIINNIHDMTQTSQENLMYIQGHPATVVGNPAGGYGNNNTGYFTSGHIYIGSRSLASYFCDIKISSFMLYNRVLTAAEVQQNYNAQKSRFGMS